MHSYSLCMNNLLLQITQSPWWPTVLKWNLRIPYSAGFLWEVRYNLAWLNLNSPWQAQLAKSAGSYFLNVGLSTISDVVMMAPSAFGWSLVWQMESFWWQLVGLHVFAQQKRNIPFCTFKIDFHIREGRQGVGCFYTGFPVRAAFLCVLLFVEMWHK